ncbi:MAG: type VI secretion system tip protein TssI/VgrG [Polyangiales bacterium]
MDPSPLLSFEAPPEAEALDFEALACRVREAMSEPGVASVELRCGEADPAVVEGALLGGDARLVLPGGGRCFRGVVTRVSLRGLAADGARARYRVRVEAPLALLGRTRDSRIFQDLNVPAVIDRVVAKHPRVRLAWQLSGTYAPRPYCVQHQESDLAFLSRLLAEEGIRYHVDHEAPEPDGPRVVLTDAPTFARPIDGDPTLVYREAERARDAATVTRLARRRAVAAGRFTLREFDWGRPDRVHHAEASAQRAAGRFDESTLERYEHHGEHEAARVARDVAAVALQQRRRRAETLEVRTACPRLAPGRWITLEAPSLPGVEGDYVALSVEHTARESEGADGGFDARYEARAVLVPRGAAVRPARPPRQVQQVLETATVTGPPGEDVHTDVHGRVKVQFHWDREGQRDAHSSCWIRVMQLWAGEGYGGQFIPRVGTEVVVSFVGGDADRPVVLGCLYNGTHPTPFALPAQRTRSGIRTHSAPGGERYNELSFEDAAGDEEVRLHAGRDFREVVRENHSMDVGGDSALSVSADRTETVGGNRLETVRGERAVTVMGGETLLVLGGRRVSVDGDHDRDVRGVGSERYASDLAMHVAGAFQLAVGRDPGAPDDEGDDVVSNATMTVRGSYHAAVDEDVVLQANRSLTLRCGKSVIELTPEGVTLRAAALAVDVEKAAEVRADDVLITAKDDLELNAEELRAYGFSSRMVLGTGAELRGQGVKIGRGGGKPMAMSPPPEGTAIFKFEHAGSREPIQGLAVTITHPDGTDHAYVTDDRGEVWIEGAAPRALYTLRGEAGAGALELRRFKTRRR